MPPPSHSASSTLRKTAAQARSQVRLLNTEMHWMFVNAINFPGCSWRDHCSSVHLLSWEGRANALQGEDTHQVCVSEACQGLSSQKGCFQVPYSSGLDLSNLARVPSLSRSFIELLFQILFQDGSWGGYVLWGGDRGHEPGSPLGGKGSRAVQDPWVRNGDQKHILR